MKTTSPSTTAPCVGIAKIRKPRKPKDSDTVFPIDTKRLSLNQWYKELSEASGVWNDSVKRIFDALPEFVAGKLREHKECNIPNIVVFRLKDTKAVPARTKKFKEKEIHLSAKPAGKRVHPLILRSFRKTISQVNA